MKAFVRNIQNHVLYEYLGGNMYKNTITGKEGEVDEETARKIFRINLDATFLINEYPNLEIAISRLGLRVDAN